MLKRLMGTNSDLGASGGGPYENCLTASANSGMGVQSLLFLNQKGNSV
jgi:hypothetical protein